MSHVGASMMAVVRDEAGKGFVIDGRITNNLLRNGGCLTMDHSE